MKDNSFVRGVLAIRIYFNDGSQTPMADLLMADHVTETIVWTDASQREQYDAGINGYTLIYDERPKATWNEMCGLKKSVYRVAELNVDGCGGEATEYVEFSRQLSKEEQAQFSAALKVAKENHGEDADTSGMVEAALKIFGKLDGKVCYPPFEGAFEF